MINYLKVKHILVVCLFLSLCLDKIVEANESNDQIYLAAWQSGKYIQLRWNIDSDEQIAGYNIYRSLTTDGEWEKLNSSPISIDSFVDYSPLQSEIVYYRVTRLDVEQNEFLTATVEVKWKEDKKIKGGWNRGASAIPFDKNNIISHQQLTNYSSMTLKQIQDFLVSQGSILKDFSFNGKSAAQHIYDACQTHKINPQVVLVTLQKEMGLITSPTVSFDHNNDLRAKTDAEKWRLSLAMGWDPSNRFDNHNFASQIYSGTKQFRRYYENLRKYGWSIGQPHKINDGVVNPVNVSTAGLYIYTPYIGEKNGFRGNYMFWYLWYNIFSFNGLAGIPEQTKDKSLLAPTLVSPSDKSTVNTTPTFRWKSVPNAEYYSLYISKSPYGSGNLVFNSKKDYGKISGTSFTLPDGILKSGLKYRWNMRAQSDEDWSNFSNPRYLTVISEEVFPPNLTEKNESSVPAKQSLLSNAVKGQKSAPLDDQREVEQLSSAVDNGVTLARSKSLSSNEVKGSIQPTVSVKSFFSNALLGGGSMLAIIIILFILAAGTIVGIKFLRRRIRQGDKNSATDETLAPNEVKATLKTDDIYDVVELLAQVIHQLEETEEDEKLKKFKEDILAQVNKTDIETPAERQPIKEDLKKAIHLSEYDDISILAETLARLVSEYRETYQKFRQTIANRYKQLQEASQYIDEQTEKLNQLTEKNEDIFTDEMQASKNPLKYAEVHNLAEQGIDHTEIAQKTKLPVGEVNLLLSLSEHIELEE